MRQSYRPSSKGVSSGNGQRKTCVILTAPCQLYYLARPSPTRPANRLWTHDASNRQVELARSLPPSVKEPGHKTSTYEQRQASRSGDVLDLHNRNAYEIAKGRESGKCSGLQSAANLFMGKCSKKRCEVRSGTDVEEELEKCRGGII